MRRHVAGDLGQRRGQRRRPAGEDRAGTVRRQLPVAGQRSGQQEARGRRRRPRRARRPGTTSAVLFPSRPRRSAAEEAGVQADPGDQAGQHPEERRDGHDRDVAVRDVGELVGEDPFQLLGVQAAQEARGRAEHRPVLAAPGGEGVGDVDVGDRHRGLGHVRQRAQPVDDGVQLGRLFPGHDPPVHRVEGDAVGEPVLREQQPAGEDDGQDGALEQHEERCGEHDVEQPEQERRDQHPAGQPSVGREAALHRRHPGMRPFLAEERRSPRRGVLAGPGQDDVGPGQVARRQRGAEGTDPRRPASSELLGEPRLVACIHRFGRAASSSTFSSVRWASSTWSWPSPMIRTITSGPPAAARSGGERPGCGARPPAVAVLSWASSASTSRPSRHAVELGLDVVLGRAVASSSAPDASSSSIAPARACSCAVLSSARCIARPTSLISSLIPETASPIRVCASAAV